MKVTIVKHGVDLTTLYSRI